MAGQFTIVVGQEIMLVTAGQTTTEWTVTRKSEAPSAEANHPVGTEVFHFLTAEALSNFVIKNQTTEQTSANFNIGGAAVIKETLKVGGETSLTGKVEVKTTVNSASVSATDLLAEPTFTGSGNNPLGLLVKMLATPSASIGTAQGALYRAEGNPAVGVTITSLVGSSYTVATGSGAGAITATVALKMNTPVLGSIKPTSCTGVVVANQGAAGVTTSVGVDVEEQKGATTSIGVRIAKGEKYALQLSDTGGTTAGGITFGTDTAIFRSAAKVLKVTTILDAETGFRVNGAATAGQYLRGDGTNFVSNTIQAADVPNLFGAVEAAKEEESGKEVEPSATLDKVVYIRGKFKAEAINAEIIVDGNVVWQQEETLVAADLSFNAVIFVKAKGKFQLKMTTGAAVKYKYLLQNK